MPVDVTYLLWKSCKRCHYFHLGSMGVLGCIKLCWSLSKSDWFKLPGLIIRPSGRPRCNQRGSTAPKFFEILKISLQFHIYFTYRPSRILKVIFNILKLHVFFPYRRLQKNFLGPPLIRPGSSPRDWKSSPTTCPLTKCTCIIMLKKCWAAWTYNHIWAQPRAI